MPRAAGNSKTDRKKNNGDGVVGMKTTHNRQKHLWALVVQTETRRLRVSSSYLSGFQTSQENSVLYRDNPLILIISVIVKLIVKPFPVCIAFTC